MSSITIIRCTLGTFAFLASSIYLSVKTEETRIYKLLKLVEYATSSTTFSRPSSMTVDSFRFLPIDSLKLFEGGYEPSATAIELKVIKPNLKPSPYKRLGPGGVDTDLGLWLRPEYGTNTTVHGEAVSSWVDQASKVLKADGSSYSNHPVYDVDSLNYNPSIHFLDIGVSGKQGFNFGDQYFFSESANGGIHVILVGLPSKDGDKNYIFDIGMFGWRNFGMFFSTSVLAGLSCGNMFSDPVGGDVETNKLSIIEFNLEYGGDKRLLKNGKLIQKKPMVWPEIGSEQIAESPEHKDLSGPFSIGRQSKSEYHNRDDGRYYRGHLGDFIIYQGAKSTIELAKIRSYLAVKYGISLDQTTPTNYISPPGDTIWDADRAGIYKHNIFGIGKESKTAMDQRISKAANHSKGLILSTAAFEKKQSQKEIKTIENEGSYFIVSDNGKEYDTILEQSIIRSNRRLSKTYFVSSTNYDQAVHLTFEGFNAEWSLFKSNTSDFSNGVTIGKLNSEGSILTDRLNDGDFFTIIKQPTIHQLDIDKIVLSSFSPIHFYKRF